MVVGPKVPRRFLLEALLVILGINLWVSLLLVPLYHQRQELSPLVMGLAAPPLLFLAVGAWLRSWVLTLALFPLSLLAPLFVRPSLVGVNALSPLTFVIVAIASIAFIVGSTLVLSRVRTPSTPDEGRNLEDTTAGKPKWRARWLLYRGLTTITALAPCGLLYGLYLRRDAFTDLARYYPQRAGAAAALFGVLALGLWLFLFFRYIARPLRQHIRGSAAQPRHLGDVDLTPVQRPRHRFYVAVTAALLLMAAFFIYLG